ncbi:hypothetical protein Q8P09_12325 [Psychrobacter faecalis]|uniref:Uncharacterized protein n=1 Tax=Psychrobacter faecalis TaxID=180588 RepID=A0ABT9HJA3_9GAMM|nr:hypothetical protein [Psychrobacter faecalis]MDP4545861.1 hypothetical protein [Psychrobacter faecalis]
MQNATDNHSQPSEQLTSSIAEMFVSWKRLFKNKIKDEDWGIDTVFDWAEVLTELQVTKSEFDKAERAVRLAGGWPPSHPADFLALGRTEVASEYPAAQSAFTTACQNCGMRGDVKRDWKHEVVYETANRIGWGVLASATEYYFKTFQEIYEQVVSEHRNGATFVIPEERQLAYEHTPVQQGTAASANIDAFLAKFGSKKGEAV